MNSYSQYFEQLKPTFIGNHLPWLRQTREANLARFMATGFPTRHLENWKYTDLSFLAKKTFGWAPRNESVTNHMLAPYQLEKTDTFQLVFIDGCFSPNLSQIHHLPANIQLLSLNEALLDCPEQIAPYLTENSNSEGSALSHLNTAFMTDGIFLKIPENAQLTTPISLLFLTTKQEVNLFSHYKNIFLIGENSQAIILEEHAALDHDMDEIVLAKNLFTHLILNKNARLDYYKLQRENSNTTHLARTEVVQMRDSQLHSCSISLGSQLARDDLQIHLDDLGASCELNGFYVLSDTQHIDHHTRIDHHQPHGTSKECYKGILKDKAKGVFNGKVIVHPNAQKTCSQQINKNLLLSSTAEMNAKPELEIYADDVQCAHGATIGQIEPDALFYLRSRGLNEIAATTLLVHAFYEDVLTRVQHEMIRKYLQQAVTEKISSLL